MRAFRPDVVVRLDLSLHLSQYGVGELACVRVREHGRMRVSELIVRVRAHSPSERGWVRGSLDVSAYAITHHARMACARTRRDD